MEEIINYIRLFLVYGNEEAAKQVGYTANEQEWEQYKAVIVPNGHLGKEIVEPSMERPTVEQAGKTYIVRTDIIYNTFFFISRAEELINTQRDEHGRFVAKYSLLGKNNRLQIAMVDEYAHILLKLLNITPPAPRYSHIYLTHDVDTIAYYRHLRGIAGGIARGEKHAVWKSLWDIEQDPAYTFRFLVQEDHKVSKAESIFFIKHTTGKGYDYPQYRLWGLDYKDLERYIVTHDSLLGLHSSYYDKKASIKSWRKAHPEDEKFGNTMHRAHYLKCSIDEMQLLADNDVTDDFTMGFADQAGFRLQTTRAVRWINPKTYELTKLILHPLTVMDCTLSNENYMNLQTEDEAYFFCEQLFDTVRRYAGDINILWHNSIFKADNYHKSLYLKLLKGLRHYSKTEW